ncbi:hypothetical protein QBC47DRAFT_460813 [Echria macrotheca]|uniref:Uncharacterized protein n=1 Tax=Echria macrotheca TaxID=438768 RepID=A0AAJ0F6N4_9PEZI|nr:hypothetical protein QBC47DRAFT_460813 [Echria macrotheca]
MENSISTNNKMSTNISSFSSKKSVIERSRRWMSKLEGGVENMCGKVDDAREYRNNVNVIIRETVEKHRGEVHSLDSITFIVYRAVWLWTAKFNREKERPPTVTDAPFCHVDNLIHYMTARSNSLMVLQEYVETTCKRHLESLAALQAPEPRAPPPPTPEPSQPASPSQAPKDKSMPAKQVKSDHPDRTAVLHDKFPFIQNGSLPFDEFVKLELQALKEYLDTEKEPSFEAATHLADAILSTYREGPKQELLQLDLALRDYLGERFFKESSSKAPSALSSWDEKSEQKFKIKIEDTSSC